MTKNGTAAGKDAQRKPSAGVRTAFVHLTPPGLLAVLYPLAWLANRSGFARNLTLQLMPLGIALLICGLVLLLWASIQFRRFKTTIIPAGQPTAMLERGPYRFSRNPIYLADLIISSGVAFVLGGFAYFFVPGFLFVILHMAFIPIEEKKMSAQFGVRFDEYRRRVRRWV